MTIIMKNHFPVAYAANEEEAKKMVIEKVFKDSFFIPKTWEHACRLSNCNIIYTFVTVSDKL